MSWAGRRWHINIHDIVRIAWEWRRHPQRFYPLQRFTRSKKTDDDHSLPVVPNTHGDLHSPGACRVGESRLDNPHTQFTPGLTAARRPTCGPGGARQRGPIIFWMSSARLDLDAGSRNVGPPAVLPCIALNAFLATSICFANELGNLCDEVGADGRRIAEVLRLEPRIGSKAMLFPGLGFAGGTLARDMQTLKSIGDRSALETPLLDGAWESNRQQNQLVLRKLKKAFSSLANVRATILGLTYKPDTSTLRRSAALEIIVDMVREGMWVSAHDPKADRAEVATHTDFRFFEDVYSAVEGAEVLVMITPWPEYKSLDFSRVRGNLCPGPS